MQIDGKERGQGAALAIPVETCQGNLMSNVCAESVDKKNSEHEMNVAIPTHEGLHIIAPLLARLEGTNRAVVFLQDYCADHAVGYARAIASANPQNNV